MIVLDSVCAHTKHGKHEEVPLEVLSKMDALLSQLSCFSIFITAKEKEFVNRELGKKRLWGKGTPLDFLY